MNDKPKPTVLLTDDEDHIRKLVKFVIQSMNCKVVAEACNGEEAVALYKVHNPHITFLDINMPQMSGIDALSEIMKINPNAMVIMLTSLTDVDTVQKCISLGAASYIRKDVPIDEMKLMIRDAWDDNRTKR